MGNSDAASAPARDAKKRGNRSAAKLRQNKLDSRRGQWMSKGKGNDSKDSKVASKDSKVASSPTGAGSNAGSPILASPHPPLPRRRVDSRPRGSDPEESHREDADAASLEVDGSVIDSPMHSPSSDKSQGGGCPQRKGFSGNGGGPSLSSGSSVWSSSRSVSDAEDDTGCPEDDSEVFDDWEMAADALYVDDSPCNQSSGPTTIPPPAPTNAAPAHAARPEAIRSKTRAWAPDDIFRPQSLPSICKQASFPASIGNRWPEMGMSAAQQGILSLPLSCPICCNELDRTDSSFRPCACGFHLCLFCYNRIKLEDGRCPGCRKQYDADSAAEGGGGGANATVGIGREMENVPPMRLSRSCSMGPSY